MTVDLQESMEPIKSLINERVYEELNQLSLGLMIMRGLNFFSPSNALRYRAVHPTHQYNKTYKSKNLGWFPND